MQGNDSSANRRRGTGLTRPGGPHPVPLPLGEVAWIPACAGMAGRGGGQGGGWWSFERCSSGRCGLVELRHQAQNRSTVWAAKPAVSATTSRGTTCCRSVRDGGGGLDLLAIAQAFPRNR